MGTNLFDINNILDDSKKKPIEEKPTSNYAYSGIPLNQIKVDSSPNKSNEMNKFNSSGSNNNNNQFNSPGTMYNMNTPIYNTGNFNMNVGPNQYNQQFNQQYNQQYNQQNNPQNYMMNQQYSKYNQSNVNMKETGFFVSLFQFSFHSLYIP